MDPILTTKCSVCGMKITFPAGRDETVCEYCFRPNARPKSEATETTLMKYANERRNLGEFDEAEAAYRKVLQANTEEHEARWGLLLCKFGVMYVEDPDTQRRRMVICRAAPSVLRAEADYRVCCRQAGAAVRGDYEQDALYIDRVQTELRRLSREGASPDVFLCFSPADADYAPTPDADMARDIYLMLTRRGFRAFYAPQSLRGVTGEKRDAAILHALISARTMLAVGTRREYLEIAAARSDWRRYLRMIDGGEAKRLVPVYRGPDPAAALPEEFSLRCLQGLDMDAPDFEDALCRAVGGEEKSVSLLLQRALFRVEDGRFDDAVAALDEVIDIAPNCAAAHLGMCMARAHVRYEEDLPNLDAPLDQEPSFRRALQFASPSQRQEWQAYVNAQRERLARVAEEAARLAKERAEAAARQARAEAEDRRLLEEARGFVEREEYEAALARLEALGDRMDTSELAARVELGLDRVRRYEEALARIERGEYGAALPMLRALGSFRDAPQRLAMVKEAIAGRRPEREKPALPWLRRSQPAQPEPAQGEAPARPARPAVDPGKAVNFRDSALEAAVRQALGIRSGQLRAGDVCGLRKLMASNKRIEDLSGIEYLTGLTDLVLAFNQIEDIRPLAVLDGLVTLQLNNNRISDITPLAGLTQLTTLRLFNNAIRDIAPLGALTQLTALQLNANQVTDVAALASLRELTTLDLRFNQIRDLLPLRGLEALKNLSVSWSCLSQDSRRALREMNIPNLVRS